MSPELIATEKQTRLASLREKEARIVQAIEESYDIEIRLLLKGRPQEAEAQQRQTADLKHKKECIRTEIRDLS
jgi:hypothetical protein